MDSSIRVRGLIQATPRAGRDRRGQPTREGEEEIFSKECLLSSD